MFTKSRLFILFLTLICFIAWLVSDLIKTPASFTPDEATTKALEPLNPEFDQSTLSIIQQSNRLQTAPAQTITARATPTPTPTPRATPTPTPIPTPTIASPSASIQP